MLLDPQLDGAREVGAEEVPCDIGAENTDELWEEGQEEPCDLVDCVPPKLTVAGDGILKPNG